MELKHVLEAQQFDRDFLEKEFFPWAKKMRNIARTGGCGIYLDKQMIIFFYEPSTRTRASFEIAMNLLGGRVVFSTENAAQFSSIAKGETLEDTIRVLNRYRPDVIVLRTNQTGGAKIAASVSEVPIINAGDGRGEHPTQALLDVYTIWQRFGRIDDISVAMVGDLAHGRTVRSLSYLLGKFKGIKIYFVAPDELRIGDDIKSYLQEKGIPFFEANDLREVAPIVDVVYQTRTQRERGAVLDRKDLAKGFFVVNKAVAEMMRKAAIIMHPLPRNEEITPEVDADPRAVYLTEQVEAGLYTRMALLRIIIG